MFTALVPLIFFHKSTRPTTVFISVPEHYWYGCKQWQSNFIFCGSSAVLVAREHPHIGFLNPQAQGSSTTIMKYLVYVTLSGCINTFPNVGSKDFVTGESKRLLGKVNKVSRGFLCPVNDDLLTENEARSTINLCCLGTKHQIYTHLENPQLSNVPVTQPTWKGSPSSHLNDWANCLAITH